MRILLDTHFVVWLVSEPDVLNVAEEALLIGSEHELMVSALSIWELRVKSMAQARRRGEPPAITAAEAIGFCVGNDLPIVSPAVEDYAASLSPPLDHTDPFDEMLLVHAQQLNAQLLTRDARLRNHPLALRA